MWSQEWWWSGGVEENSFRSGGGVKVKLPNKDGLKVVLFINKLSAIQIH